MKKIVILLLAGLVFAVNAHAEDNALASKSVHWYIKAKVITEDIDALKAVISELVEITKTETGVTNYEFYLSENNMLYVFERYLNSDAGAVHGANVRETEAMKNIFSMLEPKEFVLFGGPYEGPWGDYIKSQGISPKLIGGFNR